MATPFSNIYTRTLNKINDINIRQKILAGQQVQVDALLKQYLNSAIPKFFQCKTNLTDVDNILNQFNQTLLPIEEEILSILILLEWLEPFINNILLLKPILAPSDYKSYSNANMLKELQELKQQHKRDVDNLIIQYTYFNNDIKNNFS